MSEKYVRQTKEIDGTTFYVLPFNSFKAILLQKRIAEIVGPSVITLISGVKEGLGDMDISVVSGVLEATLSKLSEDKFSKFLVDLLEKVSIDIGGAELFLIKDGRVLDTIFDSAFQLETMKLYKVIWFVLEANYPDFLSKIKGFGDVLQKTDGIGKPTGDNKRSYKK